MRTLTNRTERQTEVTIVHPSGNVVTYAEYADLETVVHEGFYIKEWPKRTLIQAAKAANRDCLTGTRFDFRDDIDAAIELLDLTFGDWEPEAYEGWTSI